MSPRDITTPARPDAPALLPAADAPDRLTLACILYLLFPAVPFLLGWAQGWAAGLALGAAAASLALSPGWRGAWPLPARVTFLALAAGLGWGGFTGAAHFLYSTVDWQVRDAVLRDLATHSWPVAYDEEVVWLLRAPIGYFLPAAMLGRVLGFAAGQVALWVWTALGLALLLMLLARLARGLGVPAWGLAVVFALFGGLDILPNMVLDGRAGAGVFASWGRGGEWWGRAFQYPGHVTALLWAPNHALPAWLGALLLLRHARHPGFAGALALPIAAGAFWSPVGAGGAALLALFLCRWRDLLRGPANWLAVPFAIPLCLYLVAETEGVPAAFLLSARADGWWRWPLFVAVEVLPWALAAWWAWRARAVWAAALILVVLPLVVFGAGNEAASRGSAASLAVLAVAGGAALWRLSGWRRAALAGVAALAVAGSAMEASLLVAHEPWRASTRCTVPEAARQSVFREVTDWSHYLAPWPAPTLAPWLQVPHPRPIPERSPPCWPPEED